MRISDWSSDVCSSDLVVSNLIASAIDAMSSVTDRPRVLRVKSERHASGSVLVSVGDSGTGVEPENKERIFEPFFTTKSDGLGMGLMFCRSIIEVHGGRLWVTENVPQGTILRFTLPDNDDGARSEEPTSELQSLMRISYAVYCLKKKTTQ